MSSWTSFINKIESKINVLDAKGCDVPFFRGHSISSWPLLPSIFRIPNRFAGLESVLYYEFHSYSAQLLLGKVTSWDILFEMRHHGVPTRLLDWSENFAVALYFALNGNDTALNPCIWMLDPFALNTQSTGKESILVPELDIEVNYYDDFIKKITIQNKDPIAIYPKKQSPRVFAQKGVFTIFGSNEKPLEKLYPTCLTKFEIPIDAIPEANTFLKLAGIDEFSIYPDLDGLARLLIKKHCT
ncbi:FRG domain-containing protein [Clostridium sp. CF012]|uniref:FRG domain-containing protein n=1 Tax=Clostridium sp. CF012 TaxID=2843319 RepID=UPI001C0C50F0|nr:FRG domain-containing protein [Clostridium sp. CF012]MBU3145991.1 FRG domain-containing protein [Clostridium sp. CF012]